LAALGIEVVTGARATGLADGGRSVRVEIGTAARDLPSEKVLVAIGRRPRTSGWGLERLDLGMSGAFVAIDERCATSMRNVWAVGDVTGEPMLAHRAMAQGEMVADLIAGVRRAFQPVAIPSVCFTDPEIVSVGLSPAQARETGHEVRTGLFPLHANGRAMTLEAEDGFVRVTARADNHVLLGVQAVGIGVSELCAAFSLALEMGSRLEDVAGTIHAHPTLGEAFHESSLKALGEALHV
jgi:dihydrolipoamide dehydrogenase